MAGLGHINQRKLPTLKMCRNGGNLEVTNPSGARTKGEQRKYTLKQNLHKAAYKILTIALLLLDLDIINHSLFVVQFSKSPFAWFLLKSDEQV